MQAHTTKLSTRDGELRAGCSCGWYSHGMPAKMVREDAERHVRQTGPMAETDRSYRGDF